MTRHMAAAAVLTALAGAPTVAHAIGSGPVPPATARPSAAVADRAAAHATPAPAADRPATGVRTVRPGQRVEAAPGVRLWLTREGKHWALPGEPAQFRSVTDGNIDPSVPGVSLQAEPVGTPGDGYYFLSGLWYGSRAAARVEVVTADGTSAARMVTLPGRKGWGAWYTSTPLPGSGSGSGSGDFVHRVTLYDAAGNELARLGLR
ncbi:hypothetical protein [Streptomyces genisteinicus]|uniref:Tat pathway signal sequence domain protein n=1 Tax=Streptomyces genisteinicus TaxID=2768068 RepID=A0A7H0HSG3_9ACTN|nr:hypothetical protein [Streptomyces genisteinicus]QNP63479.1 hypothetical protein IAG43_11415 [Streptomyces genisteinicus]